MSSCFAPYVDKKNCNRNFLNIVETFVSSAGTNTTESPIGNDPMLDSPVNSLSEGKQESIQSSDSEFY